MTLAHSTRSCAQTTTTAAAERANRYKRPSRQTMYNVMEVIRLAGQKYACVTYQEGADALGVSTTTVSGWCKAYDIAAHRRFDRTINQVETRRRTDQARVTAGKTRVEMEDLLCWTPGRSRMLHTGHYWTRAEASRWAKALGLRASDVIALHSYEELGE